MQVSVVGGAGFVGAHLVRDLCAAGAKTLVLDSRELAPGQGDQPGVAEKLAYRRRQLLSNAEIVRCDVSEKTCAAQALDGKEIDCLYYLAALPVVHLANQNYVEAADSMIRGLINCLEIARESKSVRRFVYVSSSMVYGSFTQNPLPETAATAPTNLYGGFKLAGETLTRAYLGNTDIESVIIRPTGVYGPTGLNNTVVQTFCETAIAGGVLEARDARDTFIDFTWVEDLTAGLAQAGLVPGIGGETFNLSFGRARSLSELVEMVVAAQPGTRVLFAAEHDRTRPRRGGALDIAKARERLGYAPQVDLEAGVLRYLEFLRGGVSRPRAGASYA